MAGLLFPFVTLVVLGAVWRFIPRQPSPEDLRKHLTAVVMNIFLPALTFRVMYRANPDQSFWIVPSIGISCVVISVAIALLLYRVLSRLLKHKIDNPTLGACILGAAWGNITFLGLPFLSMVYGAWSQKVAVLFDLAATTPLLYTFGVYIASKYGEDGKSKGHALMRFLKLPPLWGAATGLIVQAMGLRLPGALDKTLLMMGNAVTPLMTFCVGLALVFPRTRREWMGLSWLAPAIGVKLIVSPLLAILISRLLPASSVIEPSIVETGMPTMVVTLLIADAYGLNTKAMAQIIALSTALSIFTLPLVKAYAAGGLVF